MVRIFRQTLVAVLGTLVAIELALQVASLVARPLMIRQSADGEAAAATTILCVGDSHTYGAPLPEEESYPAQLEVALNERYPSRNFRVVNLGFPGVNSTFIAGRLEGQILQIRPELVLVSSGLNNKWNDLLADEPSESTWSAVRRGLLRVKLFRLAAVARETEFYAPPESGDTRWRHPDHDTVRKQLQGEFLAVWGMDNKNKKIVPERQAARAILVRDMEAMVKIAQALNVPIMWYNYPAINEGQEFISKAISATAGRLGVPVVEATSSMRRAIADGHNLGTLFVEAAGPHPRQILYQYIVEDMVPRVAAVLDLDTR